jgi:hypothetical protein
MIPPLKRGAGGICFYKSRANPPKSPLGPRGTLVKGDLIVNGRSMSISELIVGIEELPYKFSNIFTFCQAIGNFL